MTPSTSNVDTTIIEYTEPTVTYQINIDKGTISGKCDGLDAIKQAVYKALNTPRYNYSIYSWNYGSELFNLFGKPISYIYPEIKKYIEECLLSDDRIESVGDFCYEKSKGTLSVSFTVVSTQGDFESEVSVNV